MLNINKILVPTDFSENAATAYHPAEQLAQRFGAKIDMIYVLPAMQYLNGSMTELGLLPMNIGADLYPRIHKKAVAELQELMEEKISTEVRGKPVVEVGPAPADIIAEFVAKNDYDIIVMAVNGKHGSHLFRGSTTEKIVRYSPIPVLTTDESDLNTFHDVLVPTDGSQESFEAFPFAVSIALAFDVSITLFHLWEADGLLEEQTPNTGDEINLESLRRIIFSRLKDYFFHISDKITFEKRDQLEGRLIYNDEETSTKISLTLVIEKGISAHHAITVYAMEHADMVVMATHGRSGLSHLFLGSTTEKVVRHLKLPVLTVKSNLEKLA